MHGPQDAQVQDFHEFIPKIEIEEEEIQLIPNKKRERDYVNSIHELGEDRKGKVLKTGNDFENRGYSQLDNVYWSDDDNESSQSQSGGKKRKRTKKGKSLKKKRKNLNKKTMKKRKTTKKRRVLM